MIKTLSKRKVPEVYTIPVHQFQRCNSIQRSNIW